ncbi:MAG: 50S ribosomal protein L18 [Spirochaetales bacterium]|nr:50S ribosomal protein L18 [Spirochaetales bacterium]
MKKLHDKIRKRIRRKFSIRKKIKCSPERPRMTIYKSNKYTYVQVIDDFQGKTIAAASNLEKDFRNVKNTVKDIGKIGEAIGDRLKKKNITTVTFDRNGFPYHGIVKAVADGVRKVGIKV